jgi:hypothetical protein
MASTISVPTAANVGGFSTEVATDQVADATTFTVTAFFQTVAALHDADADCGGTTSALTGNATAKTVAELTLSITGADLPPSPSVLTFSIKPTDGTLGTDDAIVHGIWFEYTRKTLTS